MTANDDGQRATPIDLGMNFDSHTEFGNDARPALQAVVSIMSALLMNCVAFADVAVAVAPEALRLQPIAEMQTGEATPSIIDGQPAAGEDFPASFQVPVGKLICTFFLVGKKSLVTAAHCVQDVRIISIKTSAKEYTGECESPKEYPNDLSQDWALCLLSADFQLPLYLGHPISGYEVIAAANIPVGSLVLITGFGCVKEGGPPDKTYRLGWAKVSEAPPSARLPGAVGRTPNTIVLRSTPAELCKGDSGGPAFVTRDRSLQYRTVIGVNSDVLHEISSSYLASLSTKAAKDFIKKWSDSHDHQKICGVHNDADNCRPISP